MFSYLPYHDSPTMRLPGAQQKLGAALAACGRGHSRVMGLGATAPTPAQEVEALYQSLLAQIHAVQALFKASQAQLRPGTVAEVNERMFKLVSALEIRKAQAATSAQRGDEAYVQQMQMMQLDVQKNVDTIRQRIERDVAQATITPRPTPRGDSGQAVSIPDVQIPGARDNRVRVAVAVLGGVVVLGVAAYALGRWVF
ncbi:MAG: hypothetical protein JSV86_05450 [Gemmatimonadota bacterium]|nr:MAG: hypothetical protein JSV86_05450 [Gemmatimonadota bacterium]